MSAQLLGFGVKATLVVSADVCVAPSNFVMVPNFDVIVVTDFGVEVVNLGVPVPNFMVTVPSLVVKAFAFELPNLSVVDATVLDVDAAFPVDVVIVFFLELVATGVDSVDSFFRPTGLSSVDGVECMESSCEEDCGGVFVADTFGLMAAKLKNMHILYIKYL